MSCSIGYITCVNCIILANWPLQFTADRLGIGDDTPQWLTQYRCQVFPEQCPGCHIFLWWSYPINWFQILFKLEIKSVRHGTSADAEYHSISDAFQYV